MVVRQSLHTYNCTAYIEVADPGFLLERNTNLVRGCQLPTWLRCIKIACQNEKIGTHEGARQVHPLPLYPLMQRMKEETFVPIHYECFVRLAK